MKIVITDVSVFFDLHALQILPEFFGLDWHIQTTNFVYNEILQADQIRDFENFVRSRLLHLISISVDDETAINAMELKRRNRSFPDKTVLWKAREEKCTLLTCDRVLREEAIHHNIEVHGSLWVIEQLVYNELMENETAIRHLKKLITINTRLPVEEIKKLIERLKSEDIHDSTRLYS